MKSTFQDQTLIQGDYLRRWQEIPDQSVDLILADPPYGCLKSAQPWDIQTNFHVLAWISEQQLKPNGQIAIFGNFMCAVEIQNAFSKYFDHRYPWTWVKPNAIPINHFRPANNTETLLVYKRKRTRVRDLTFNVDELRVGGEPYIRQAGASQNKNPTKKGGGEMPAIFENESGDRYPRAVLYFPNKPSMDQVERTSHPTQKPVALLEYVIKGLTNPGDTVLDPFCGSASTLVAAHRQSRMGIGFELSEEYYKMGYDRLARETQGVI